MSVGSSGTDKTAAAAAEAARPGASPVVRRSLRTVLHALMQGVLKLSYPLMILCAWHWDMPRYIGLALFVLLWLQRWFGTGMVAHSLRRLSLLDWCVAGMLSAASASIVLTNSELLLCLYPAAVNLGLLIAFGATLVKGPPMIEKFARLGKSSLGPHALRHTRRVTWVWCGFFALNGAFSAYTAFAWSHAAWALYNGGIVYALIGALLVGELLWRYLIVQRRAARSELA